MSVFVSISIQDFASYAALSWIIAVGIQVPACDHWDLLFDDMATATSIYEFAFDPPGLVAVHESDDLNGKKGHGFLSNNESRPAASPT